MKPGFIAGLTFWTRGWGMLLRHRSLIGLSVIPFFISVSVAVVTMSYVYSHLPAWVTSLLTSILSSSPDFLKFLYYPLLLGSGVLVLIGGVFVAYVGQSLIAVPFYALLADRSLSILGARPGEAFIFKRWLRNSMHMLRISLMKTALFLILGALLFVLSFVPVVNVFAMFGTLMILTFDLLDYSMESLQFGFRRRLLFAAGHKRMWCGMAAGLGLTMLIPGLTLVLAPGAVVGGALLLKESMNGTRTAAS